MVAEKTLAHRWLPRIATAALLFAAVAATASPAARRGTRQLPSARTQPPGYEIIASGAGAPPGAFNSGAFATCPAGTVVWGGGVALSGFPRCQPHRQHVQPERERRLGSEGQQHRDNGGAVRGQLRSARTSRRVTRSFLRRWTTHRTPSRIPRHLPIPECPAWRGHAVRLPTRWGPFSPVAWPRCSAKFTGFMYNGTTSDANFIVYAICGHKRAGYKIASNDFVVDPDSTAEDGVLCPTGTSALDAWRSGPGPHPSRPSRRIDRPGPFRLDHCHERRRAVDGSGDRAT